MFTSGLRPLDRGARTRNILSRATRALFSRAFGARTVVTARSLIGLSRLAASLCTTLYTLLVLLHLVQGRYLQTAETACLDTDL